MSRVVASWKTRGSARTILLTQNETSGAYCTWEHERGVMGGGEIFTAKDDHDAIAYVEQQVKLAKDIDGITFKRC